VALLELSGVSRHFGAVAALEDVSLRLEAGEVLGLVGDNGAGKSTLLRIVAGSLPPTRGELRLDGERLRFAGPAQARARGIEIVHQDLALCPNLTAAENVFLGREPLRRRLGCLPVLDRPAMRERTRALFAELRSDARPDAKVAELSGGQRQAVAIARTRLAAARVVLLDEPTAAIALPQVEEVLRLVRQLAEARVAVVLVSHRLPDVFAVCERVAVLRRGRKVADKPLAQSSPQELTALLTGALEAA
jgi:simple sugar transport system ATP-binding protein